MLISKRPDADSLPELYRHLESLNGWLVGVSDEPELIMNIILGSPKKNGLTQFEFACPEAWDGEELSINGAQE